LPETTNVLIVGVGGQGVLLAGEVLAGAVLNCGLDVKKSEVHGMSQRGGVVSSHVRYGERVFSPTIAEGEVHFLVAFEELEALRWCHYLTDDGLALVNEYRVIPPSSYLGKTGYPKEPLARLRREVSRVNVLPAQQTAAELGNPQAASAVMLGALAESAELPQEAWEKSLEERVPPRWLALNQEAFARGVQAARDTGVDETH